MERRFNVTTVINISAGLAIHCGQVKDRIFAKDQHVNLSALKSHNLHGQDRFLCTTIHKHKNSFPSNYLRKELVPDAMQSFKFRLIANTVIVFAWVVINTVSALFASNWHLKMEVNISSVD